MLFKSSLTLAASALCLLSIAQSGQPVMELGGKKLNLYALEEDKSSKSKYAFSFVKDTMNEVKLPKNMWGIDTVIQMDLETQEEVVTYQTDSMLRLHNDAGQLTKAEIIVGITEGFALSKNCDCNLVSADLVLAADKGNAVHIDYSKPEDINTANQKVNALSKGARVILKRVVFKCPGNQGGNDELQFEDLVIAKVKE